MEAAGTAAAAAARAKTPEQVVVHPLVLLSVVDHYNRVATDTRKRVVGVLLGESYKGRIDATNAFAGALVQPACLLRPGCAGPAVASSGMGTRSCGSERAHCPHECPPAAGARSTAGARPPAHRIARAALRRPLACLHPNHRLLHAAMQCRLRRMTGIHPSGSWTTRTWKPCSACSRRSTVSCWGCAETVPIGPEMGRLGQGSRRWTQAARAAEVKFSSSSWQPACAFSAAPLAAAAHGAALCWHRIRTAAPISPCPHVYLLYVCPPPPAPAARERVIGWYHTGPRLREADIDIHALLARYCDNPLLVICEVQVRLSRREQGGSRCGSTGIVRQASACRRRMPACSPCPSLLPRLLSWPPSPPCSPHLLLATSAQGNGPAGARLPGA